VFSALSFETERNHSTFPFCSVFDGHNPMVATGTSLELATSSTLAMVIIIPNDNKERRRSVRFSNDPRRPDLVAVQIQYIESITDPYELAQVQSSRSERDRYRRDTRAAAMAALIDNAALLEDIQQAFFFGPYRPGGADRKLRLLIQWNLSNETHRGLERYIFEETLLVGRRRQKQQQQTAAAVAGFSSDDGRLVKWAVFLALADCVVVHGMSKLYDDVSFVREHQSSLLSSSVSCHCQ
jgi:hypothetical protein